MKRGDRASPDGSGVALHHAPADLRTVIETVDRPALGAGVANELAIDDQARVPIRVDASPITRRFIRKSVSRGRKKA